MSQSPLQLDRYFFAEVNIRTYSQGNPDAAPVAQCSVHVSTHPENIRNKLIELRVELGNPEGKNASYVGNILIVGLFSVIEDYSEEKVESLVTVNGASILYGAVREMVANITARGPWRCVTLPSVSFLETAKRNHQPHTPPKGQKPVSSKGSKVIKKKMQDTPSR